MSLKSSVEDDYSIDAKPLKQDEPFSYVFILALCLILQAQEQKKAAASSREEVETTRDSAVCVALHITQKRKMDLERKYGDLNPEQVWDEWQLFLSMGLEAWSKAFRQQWHTMVIDKIIYHC